MDRKLISALIVMISIFGFFALGLPNYSRIKSLRAAVNERESFLAEKKLTIEKITSLAKQIDSGKANIDKLGLLIPSTKSTSEIISAIENGASQTGLTLSEIRFSEETNYAEVKDYLKISSELKLFGSYTAATKFLEILEQNIRILDVNSFTGSLPPGQSPNSLNITIKFEAYYLK